MAFVRPEQVSPRTAQDILKFLNSAVSAEEIASGIELPGEPDIGLALANRILRRREELGGRFTTLNQLLEIPYIGPERFTDIVHALGPEILCSVSDVPGLAALSARIDALQQEIQELAARSGTAKRLVIRPDRDRVYLGQPVLLTARLTDPASGMPMVGYPVTFFTQWGRLRPVTGMDTSAGKSVTITTGSDGRAQARLCVETSEPFTIDQENALLTALDRLPSSASVPEEARQALEMTARTYASSAGLMLRKAVDILLRKFHPDPWDSINLRGLPAEWDVEKVAVIGMLQGGTAESPVGPMSGDSSVQVSAVCTLSVVDWLPAWLEIFASVQERKWGLSDRLSGVKDLTGGRYSPAGIINCHIQDMVSLQRGMAGEYAGKRCIENAASSFFQKELSKMPEEVQAGIYASLSAASRSVAATGLKGWQSMVQQQQAIELNVNSMIATNMATKADAQALDQFREQLQAEIDRRVSETAENLVSEMEERFSSITEELGAINENMGQMVSKTELESVKNELQAEISTRVSKQDLNQVASQVDRVSAEMDRRFQDSVTRAELAETETRLNQAINSRASIEEVNALDTRVNRIDTATTTMRSTINRLDMDVNRLKTGRTERPH